MEGLELAHVLIDAALDKKASDILLLDIKGLSIFTDYFLLCNGENVRQLRALARGIAEDARQKASTYPRSTEGNAESGWILVDFGDVIVHLFSPEKRDYYNLEELWGDGHVILRMQ